MELSRLSPPRIPVLNGNSLSGANDRPPEEETKEMARVGVTNGFDFGAALEAGRHDIEETTTASAAAGVAVSGTIAGGKDVKKSEGGGGGIGGVAEAHGIEADVVRGNVSAVTIEGTACYNVL